MKESTDFFTFFLNVVFSGQFGFKSRLRYSVNPSAKLKYIFSVYVYSQPQLTMQCLSLATEYLGGHSGLVQSQFKHTGSFGLQIRRIQTQRTSACSFNNGDPIHFVVNLCHGHLLTHTPGICVCVCVRPPVFVCRNWGLLSLNGYGAHGLCCLGFSRWLGTTALQPHCITSLPLPPLLAINQKVPLHEASGSINTMRSSEHWTL